MLFLKSFGMTVGLTIAIASGKLGSGPLDVDILMESYWPTHQLYFTRTTTSSVSGCANLSSDEWFLVAVQIQNHRNKLDAEERFFIDTVVNYMLTGTETVPTPDHKSWLCHLKKRLKL